MSSLNTTFNLWYVLRSAAAQNLSQNRYFPYKYLFISENWKKEYNKNKLRIYECKNLSFIEKPNALELSSYSDIVCTGSFYRNVFF